MVIGAPWALEAVVDNDGETSLVDAAQFGCNRVNSTRDPSRLNLVTCLTAYRARARTGLRSTRQLDEQLDGGDCGREI
ncbi:hypothetical protein M5K25_015641 [Dendrobium thyrsiflorum]|uniref:Uncharacterized protein n=1 Tax=Dendrobium thyrsiflorum TaxID=117978 RepID=A0ABD0URE2_DENTH